MPADSRLPWPAELPADRETGGWSRVRVFPFPAEARGAGIVGIFQMPPVHLVFERIPGQFGERVRVAGKLLQFFVRHAGIVGCQARRSRLAAQKGFVEIGHWASDTASECDR